MQNDEANRIGTFDSSQFMFNQWKAHAPIFIHWRSVNESMTIYVNGVFRACQTTVSLHYYTSTKNAIFLSKCCRQKLISLLLIMDLDFVWTFMAWWMNLSAQGFSLENNAKRKLVGCSLFLAQYEIFKKSGSSPRTILIHKFKILIEIRNMSKTKSIFTNSLISLNYFNEFYHSRDSEISIDFVEKNFNICLSHWQINRTINGRGHLMSLLSEITIKISIVVSIVSSFELSKKSQPFYFPKCL